MYYVGNHQGFLTWIDDYKEFDPWAVHSQPDVRFAHPFETFEQADTAGKEFCGGKPYAILSTLGEVTPQATKESFHADKVGVRYMKREHIRAHGTEYDDITGLYKSVTLVITDALASTSTWPAFLIVAQRDGRRNVLAFNGQVAMPDGLPAHSYFGACRYVLTLHDANAKAAEQNRSTIHMSLNPTKYGHHEND